MKISSPCVLAVLLLGIASMSGCGGGGSPPASYTVGGTVSGLRGSGLTLLNNGGSSLSVAADSTTFTFATSVTSGDPYNVTVMTQAASPSQTCTVANGSGVVGASAITNVAVTCTTNSYSVSGTVSGLSGTGLTLTDPSGGTVAVDSNGTFTLPNKILSGATYAVVVATDPNTPPQSCGIMGATGTISNGNVTGLAVTCSNSSEQLIVSDTQGHSAAFLVDPGTGALGPMNVSTGLAGTGQVGTDPAGKFAFETNSAPAGISAYTANPATGILTQVTGSPFTAPASPGGVAVDPTGKFLYTGSASGALAYTIDAVTGALSLTSGSPFAAPLVGLDPGAATCPCVATAGFLYYLQLLGAGSYSINGFAINATTGALTSIGPAGPDTCCTPDIGVATDAAGKFFFLVATSTVQTYAINATTGALTNPAIAQASVSGIAVDPSGRFAYLANGNTQSVEAFSVDPASGALTPLSPATIPSGAAPQQVRFDLSGKFVYVTNSNPKAVWAYSFDAATGALTPVAGSPFMSAVPPIAMVITRLQ